MAGLFACIPDERVEDFTPESMLLSDGTTSHDRHIPSPSLPPLEPYIDVTEVEGEICRYPNAIGE